MPKLPNALRGPRRWAAILVALWALAALPFALGERTLLQRDVFATHLPYKAFGAGELDEGRISAVQPAWGMGQPFRGNPNALPFYPGNLLYLVLPFWVAFNLHYLLHLLIAFLGVRALARALGQREEAATFAGLAYAGSGYLVTLLTFYNLLAVAAWVPVALAGLARGGRRGTIAAGLAGGMALLGGEPITAALAIPVALVVALGRHGARPGLRASAAAAALAAMVALPQIVATARVLPHAHRAVRGVALEQVTTNDLSPWRLVELVLPLPWGVPSLPPPWTHWPSALSPWPPYVYALHLGVVALAFALAAARRRPAWAALAAGAWLAGWAAGLSPEWTSAATGGLFRYPQKLLFPFTLAAAVLAGFGLEAALERPRWRRPLLLAAAAAGVLALALTAGHGSFAGWLGATFAPAAGAAVLERQATLWIVQLAGAALLLAGAGWAVGRGRAGALVALEAAGLAALLALVPTDRVAGYREPPAWVAAIEAAGAGPRVVSVPFVHPPWEARPPYRLEAFRAAARQRLDRELLEPSHAALWGLESPLAADPDGLSEPLRVVLAQSLARAEWPARVRWLRRLGVGAVVRDAPGSAAGGPAGLERLATAERLGATHELLRVPEPRPFVFRPTEARVAASPPEAYFRIASGELPDGVALVPRAVAHSPRGTARLLSARPDAIELEVEGEGGVVGLLRGFHPLWRARTAEGAELATVRVDLVLLGVEVPPGRHRVSLEISPAPELAAGAVALLAVAGAILLARESRVKRLDRRAA